MAIEALDWFVLIRARFTRPFPFTPACSRTYRLRWASACPGSFQGVSSTGDIRRVRYWRRTTILSMITSGCCALSIGLFMESHPLAVTLIALLWGFTVVADSAQFSSSVSELGNPRYMGTLLTTQTCLGFLLTLLTIRLVPSLVEAAGWHAAFGVLALGPALGCLSMWKLKNSPAARKLAGGRG